MARILLSGSSGLIGKRLAHSLLGDGHDVVPLVRADSREKVRGIRWHPESGDLYADALEHFDFVVHLAGESIAQRWTAEKKRSIRESRVGGTRLLCEALAGRARKPARLVSASAVGIYGDRGDEMLTEDSAPGRGFLADVARDWEAATGPAREAGIEVVHTRFGVVLSPEGGALAKLLPVFRMGAGGVVGGGKQYMSWISLTDAVRAIRFCLGMTVDRLETGATKADRLETGPIPLQGPVNVVAPQAATNREFTHALGDVLGRPMFVPVPALAIRWMFGEMGEATVLASQRAAPARLLAAGFRFEHETLKGALEAELHEKSGPT